MTTRNLFWASTVLSGMVLGGILSVSTTPRAWADEAEKHPKIHAAIDALKAAKEELKAADHDFGGHKKEAMGAVEKAIKQLKLADEFDKK
jgi:hypothetical protein